jgi:hypothetical protein
MPAPIIWQLQVQPAPEIGCEKLREGQTATGPSGPRSTLEALELFAGLKSHSLARRNIHFLTGARIAADARLSGLHGKNSKPPQFDSLGASHSVLQRFKNRFHGLLGLDAAHACSFELCQYGVYDIQFNQACLRCSGADARGCAPGCQDVTRRLHWHSSLTASWSHVRLTAFAKLDCLERNA